MEHLIFKANLLNDGFTILKMILFGIGYWISCKVVDKIWKFKRNSKKKVDKGTMGDKSQ